MPTRATTASAAPLLHVRVQPRARRNEVVGWQGLFGVAGTPPEIVVRLQAEVSKALRLLEVRERLAALGAEPVGSTPAEFGAFVRAENARWGRIIREKESAPSSLSRGVSIRGRAVRLWV